MSGPLDEPLDSSSKESACLRLPGRPLHGWSRRRNGFWSGISPRLDFIGRSLLPGPWRRPRQAGRADEPPGENQKAGDTGRRTVSRKCMTGHG